MFLAGRPELPTAAVSLLVLVPGLFLMGKGFRKATIIFLSAGAGILLASGADLAVWATALNTMTNTVAIMVTLQLFTIPVSAGGYDRAIKSWTVRHLSGPRSLFIFSTFITHVMTSFLMLGAIPVSTSLLGPAIRARVPTWQRFLSTSITRGYILAALWAPGAINLYLVVQATGLAWSSILLPGMVLALCGLGISIWMESGPRGAIGEVSREPGVWARAPGGEGEGAAELAPELTPREENRAVRHVLTVAFGIVLCVLALETLHIGVGYTRIMLSGGFISLLWIAALAAGNRAGAGRAELKAATSGYWEEGIMKVSDMGPFFVALGIFSVAVETSGILDAVTPALQSAATFLGVGSVAILPLVIIGLAVIGLHPFITIVLFGAILKRAGLPLTPLAIGLSLAVGGGAAYMISPFAGIIMSIARFTDSKATDVAIKWNWKFSIIFSTFGVAFALAWGTLFG